MTTCKPSNDRFSADAIAMSRCMKQPRLQPLPSAEKEKKIVMMRSRGSENVLYFHHLLPQAQPEFRETLSLPFSDNKNRPPFPDQMGRCISCGECRGLLHFDTLDGDIVVCNPTTAEFSFFPRPPKKSPQNVITFFEPSGFGYDHTSDDYKIVRISWDSYFSNQKKLSRCGYRRTVAQVYAFRSKTWKVIECPLEAQVGSLNYKSCGYVSGKYYWLHGDPASACIISFNFATDTLELSHAPKSDDIIHCLYQFVELEEGKLGAILREKPEGSRAGTRVEVWAFEKDGLWVRRFGETLDNVVRSLGFEHGLLFLEGKRSSEKLSQLVVCDLATKKLEWLEIYDKFETMEIFRYSASTYTLPDAKPMDGTCLFDDDDDGDDDDEIEDTSDEETDDEEDAEED